MWISSVTIIGVCFIVLYCNNTTRPVEDDTTQEKTDNNIALCYLTHNAPLSYFSQNPIVNAALSICNNEHALSTIDRKAILN